MGNSGRPANTEVNERSSSLASLRCPLFKRPEMVAEWRTNAFSFPTPFASAPPQSRRDCLIQTRVARNELPWATPTDTIANSEGVESGGRSGNSEFGRGTRRGRRFHAGHRLGRRRGGPEQVGIRFRGGGGLLRTDFGAARQQGGAQFFGLGSAIGKGAKTHKYGLTLPAAFEQKLAKGAKWGIAEGPRTRR